MKVPRRQFLQRTTCACALSVAVIDAGWAQDAGALSGAWNLVSAVFTDANGKSIDSFGANPVGRIILSPEGAYSLMILRSDLPKIASNNRLTATEQENKAIVLGSVAHFGSYTFANGVITLKITNSTFPNVNGMEQKREIADLKSDSWKWV